jgi:hypothetical protein
VLKVLQQLPEGLAIAVLAASPADVEHHLSMLPDSLHPLAIEAGLPSIRYQRSLSLDFKSLRNPIMVLHAAISGTTGASALKELELKHIPVRYNECLQQLISSACRSASDVRLDFRCSIPSLFPKSLPMSQIEKALSHNTALTSLQLTFGGDPWHVFNLDRLLESLTGLQSLELGSSIGLHTGYFPVSVPTPMSIANLLCLTRLCLGPSFDLEELPQLLPHLTRLQTLRLEDELNNRPELETLSSLTALQTLELLADWDVLPPLSTLTALQTLDLCGCFMPSQFPPLDALTSLETLKLGRSTDLQQLPPLHKLTALKTLMGEFVHLQEWPGLDGLSNLQSLDLFGSKQLDRLPHLANLTSL